MQPSAHRVAEAAREPLRIVLRWWAMRDSNPRPPRCKRDALPAELIALGELARCRSRSAPDGRGQFSKSRSPLPGLNLACFEAAIWIFSPVRGLRPSEAARDATENVPKPTRRTSSPPFSASAIASNTASTALLASDFRRSVLRADGVDEFVSVHEYPPGRLCGTKLGSSPKSLERERRRVNRAAVAEIGSDFAALRASVTAATSASQSVAPLLLTALQCVTTPERSPP